MDPARRADLQGVGHPAPRPGRRPLPAVEVGRREALGPDRRRRGGVRGPGHPRPSAPARPAGGPRRAARVARRAGVRSAPPASPRGPARRTGRPGRRAPRGGAGSFGAPLGLVSTGGGGRDRRGRGPARRGDLADGRRRRCRRAAGRTGEAPPPPRDGAAGDGRAVASAVQRPRGVVRLPARRRPPARARPRAGGDVGLAAARRHAAGIGVGVVGGTDAGRAAARARPRAPRRLGRAVGGRGAVVRLVVQPAGVGAAGEAPPRERAGGRRRGARARRRRRHFRDAPRRAGGERLGNTGGRGCRRRQWRVRRNWNGGCPPC